MDNDNPRLDTYYAELRQHHLGPLWNSIGRLMTHEPRPRAEAHLWRWSDVRRYVMESGTLVVPDRGGERRVIFFANPGFQELEPWGWGAMTNTLYAGVQLLLPGEKAPSHRHNQNAIRFVLEGRGAYTIVEGERIDMEPGDFLITPAGLWHDHVHAGTEPMLWFDCLDIPLLYQLGVMFFENYPDYNQPITKPSGYTEKRYQTSGLRPIQDRRTVYAPQAVFKWRSTQDALRRLAELEPDPYDGYGVEYVNPATGEAAGITIGAAMQLLPSGHHTQAHRHVHSTIYHVFRGSGYSVINGVRFAWHAGDTFVVPNWAWHEHLNTGAEDAYLFSTHDAPVMERLGLEREESYPDGYQPVTGEYPG
ncbi:MAG: cupin domain-containing protein [Sulfobacillus sp.]|nr:cupin domain-containing protein [Sulfobacillus sp.]